MDSIVSKLLVELKKEEFRIHMAEYLTWQAGKFVEFGGASFIHYHFQSFLLLSIVGTLRKVADGVL